MGESEYSVGDEVEVEELAGKDPAAFEGEEDGEGGELEADLDRDGGPGEAEDPVAPAATGVEAAEPAEGEGDRDQEAKRSPVMAS